MRIPLKIGHQRGSNKKDVVGTGLDYTPYVDTLQLEGELQLTLFQCFVFLNKKNMVTSLINFLCIYIFVA